MEIYSFQSGVLTIIDPELNISYKESFAPVMLPKSLNAGESLGDGHTLCLKEDEDGKLTEAFIEKDDRLHGQCVHFYADGSKKHECFYYMGELHGPSYFFDQKGTLLSESWFIHGKRQGKCCLFYPTGALYSLQRFYSGLRHGLQEYYYHDGTPKTTMHYEHGKLTGASILYTARGEIKRVVEARSE